ncbi:MAG: hypothetical protein PUF10_03320 [Bacteroidales bacterium]|nr:hypothetical protein [Bacteroidales bacterium]
MKKIFYVVIAVCMGLTACNKEGRFTPKHKIATIYESYSDHSEIWNSELGYWEYSDETTPKYLSEKWTWDGKTLSSIQLYNGDGSPWYTENFEYENKRISKVTYSSQSEWGLQGHWEFSYDKNGLAKADLYAGNDIYLGVDFTHNKNGKISEVRWTYFEDYYKKESFPLQRSILRLILPSDNQQILKRAEDKMLDHAAAKGVLSFTYKYEWDGDNVKRVTDGDGWQVEYEYDDMTNPLYGLLDNHLFGDGNLYDYVISKNNVVKEQYKSGNKEYTYRYDKKLPTVKICVDKDETNPYHRYTDTHTIYYEYE